MKKEKKKDTRSKASKLADKAAKKAKKKGKKSDLEKVYDLVKKGKKQPFTGYEGEKGYYAFESFVALVKRTGKKKETCSCCIHYYKERFCRKNGPSMHLAIMNRLLNCGLTEKEASDRSYFLPEVPAFWHCKNWREKE